MTVIIVDTKFWFITMKKGKYIYILPNGRKESRVTITLNKETTVSIYKTCFDILMSSSVANELLTVVHLNFILRYVTKLRV